MIKGGTKKSSRNREKLNSKQLRAISILEKKVEKGQKINLGEILIESGYSSNTAKTPQKVFGKPSVQRELELRGLDSEGLKETHEELLNAKKIELVSYPSVIPEEDIITITEKYLNWVHISTNEDQKKGIKHYHFIVPDRKIQFKALELAYKLYPPKKPEDENLMKRIHQKRLEKIQTLTGKIRTK